jgi:hypothetical protein
MICNILALAATQNYSSSCANGVTPIRVCKKSNDDHNNDEKTNYARATYNDVENGYHGEDNFLGHRHHSNVSVNNYLYFMGILQIYVCVCVYYFFTLLNR